MGCLLLTFIPSPSSDLTVVSNKILSISFSQNGKINIDSISFNFSVDVEKSDVGIRNVEVLMLSIK